MIGILTDFISKADEFFAIKGKMVFGFHTGKKFDHFLNFKSNILNYLVYLSVETHKLFAYSMKYIIKLFKKHIVPFSVLVSSLHSGP